MEHYQVGSLPFSIDLSQPLYEQILDQIRSLVAKGELELGAKIPSVRELAQSLKINPNTVMRAYQELERDGLTEKRRGQGTFITASADQVKGFREDLALQTIEEFLTKMSNLGYSRDEIVAFIKREGVR
ncbi:GntR family transcriptional regulator [Pullulanibacillus sp. KACC 23026]|uniref:GntR family transcriptional regulator n=1 Tax=Pullulanibacillus sp. KACC 23026 TaxID=3028315 RepID=UPI0023B138C6|nr:GntR family transcriptional regulator [Pullulanibacillus sp. KACC 23026]WEG10908.1 GntR family transcriptional regulator [Pullulanibacillus sp. KACC 23026]